VLTLTLTIKVQILNSNCFLNYFSSIEKLPTFSQYYTSVNSPEQIIFYSSFIETILIIFLASKLISFWLLINTGILNGSFLLACKKFVVIINFPIVP